MYSFKGTWGAETVYNVGNVAIYSDGLVYHLQKAAPAGTPCTDTLYWGMMDKDLSEAVIMINDCLGMAIGGALDGKVANNLTTEDEGKVLDARQGKTLKGYVDGLTTDVGGLQNAVGGLSAMLPDTKTLRLASSTSESTKIFDITVDDTGELSATEYTPPTPESEPEEESEP